MPSPGEWPHGLLNVPVGTMNTAILILSSVTVVLAWASLKMRRYSAYWWYMLVTILCGIIFLVRQALVTSGRRNSSTTAFSSNRRPAQSTNSTWATIIAKKKDWRRGIEITGHLHNHEALNDPNIKEYEIALDPVNADPTNPGDGSAAFLYVAADGQDRED